MVVFNVARQHFCNNDEWRMIFLSSLVFDTKEIIYQLTLSEVMIQGVAACRWNGV